MSWFRRKTPPQPSQHALDAISTAERELIEARQLRAEAEEVGAKLEHSRRVNHFGLHLERAIKGTC